MFKNLVPPSLRIEYMSITNTNQLLLLRD